MDECGLCGSEDVMREGQVVVCVECEARKLPGCYWHDPAGIRRAIAHGGGLLADER